MKQQYEKVAEQTAYHTTAFLVKYADFLKNLLSSNGQNADEVFDEITATLKGKFMEVLSQKLAEKYEPLYVAGAGHYNAEESYFDIINGGVMQDGKTDDLSLIESCLDESGIDKNILDLRVLSGVRVSSNLKYLMTGAEFSIESIGAPTFDSTWRETVYPREVIEFGKTPEEARFKDAGAYRPLKDVMEEAIQMAKAYHKTYIDTLESRVESLKKQREARREKIHATNALIMRHREDARIVPSDLYKEEEWAEADIEYINDKLDRLEEYLLAYNGAASVEYNGGKYVYKWLDKKSSQPGDDD